MDSYPMDSGPTEDDHDLTLAKVRSELDKLAERRLTSAPTSQELSRWHELVTIEERLLQRKKQRERERLRDRGWGA